MTDAAYDPVAALYDRAFSEIDVRGPELRFVARAMRALDKPRVLDVGAGTGALLRALAPQIARGEGVDVSDAMLAHARRRTPHAHLAFTRIDSPALPFANASFDVVLSFLSFRYLDWPASFREFRRVLAPGGRFVLVDLAAERARPRELPKLARAALRHVTVPLRRPAFARDVRALTAHPAWADMLARHPIRSLAEYRRFFAEALPGARFIDLDVLPGRRVVGLDSGPLSA